MIKVRLAMRPKSHRYCGNVSARCYSSSSMCNCVNCLSSWTSILIPQCSQICYSTSSSAREDGKYFQGSSRCSSSLTIDSSSRSDETINALLRSNKKWVNDMKLKDSSYFDKLGAIHNPKILYFGCSDSRVPVQKILGLEPGEVFVHRNIGNLVPVNDLNALSVLEYAVDYVGVREIFVTGHYDCGAIKAATARQELGMLDCWLRLIRDVYRLHKQYLDSITDPTEFHRKLVELNVIEQCLNLYKTGVVQRRVDKPSESGERVRITGLVFDPKEGILKKLSYKLESQLGTIRHIYGLYDE